MNLAWDTRIQRNVAIKRIALPKHSNLQSIPGLEEARTGAQLSDSRIVNVIDFEVTDDEALLIMEFVDGISLGTLMDRITRMLDLDEIASVVQNVGKALQHAHRNHVLHLDIKPDNILVDTTGMSKVTDFGIGRLANAAGFGSATGGTIGYMPPEQLQGGEVSEKTDQWAFAAMIYELIVGENPFVTTSFEHSLELIGQLEITLPSSVDDQLDPEIDDILFRALSIDPAKRYSSVARFVTDLMPHLGNPKDGRARLGKLVGIFGDEIALGSPEDRMRALRRMEEPDVAARPPLSEDDDEFYDTDEPYDEDYDDDYDDDEDYDDEPNPYDERRMVPKRSIKGALSPRGASALSKILGGVCNGSLAYIGIFGALLPYLQQNVSAYAFPTWIAWVVVAAITVVGAMWPRVGSLVSLLLLAIGMISAGWIPQGAVLLILSIIWWAFLGRLGDAQSNCAIMGPSLGIINLGFLQPIVTGWRFSLSNTLFTAVFGAALMLVVAPITGSAEMYHTTLSLMQHSTANDLFSVNVYNSAALWIVVGGWIASALIMSLFANRGSNVTTMLGVVLSGSIIIVSRILGGFASGTFYGLFTLESVTALILPIVIMCFITWICAEDSFARE